MREVRSKATDNEVETKETGKEMDSYILTKDHNNNLRLSLSAASSSSKESKSTVVRGLVVFGEKLGKNARVVQFPFLAAEPLPFTGRSVFVLRKHTFSVVYCTQSIILFL
jgi:hypothetical protein